MSWLPMLATLCALSLASLEMPGAEAIRDEIGTAPAR
jgi:hypothetical protein